MKKALTVLLSASFIFMTGCNPIPTSNEVAEESTQIVDTYSETDDYSFEDEYVSTDEYISESNDFQSVFHSIDIQYYESLEGFGDSVPSNAKPVTDTLSDNIKKETKQIVEFINNEYDLNWKVPTIDAFNYEDSSLVNEFYSVGAIYIPSAKALFINTAATDTYGYDIITYSKLIISHELVHGIIDYNRGDPFFCYANPEGKGYLGSSLHEVITEMITRNYLYSIDSNFTAHFAYDSLVYMVNNIQLLYPNFTADILTDNMSKVVEALGKEDFERILLFLDCELEAERISDGFSTLLAIYAITEYVAMTKPEKSAQVVRFFNSYTGCSFSTVDEILNFLFDLAHNQ